MTPQDATVFLTTKYREPRKALVWLERAFGLVPGDVHPPTGDHVDHAEMFIGSAGIMFGSSGDDPVSLDERPEQRTGLYVVIEDIEGHYERSRAAAAEITRELQDTDYGSREYSALDLEGHPWSFGTYLPQRPDSSA